MVRMPEVIKAVRSKINRNPVQKQKNMAREMDIEWRETRLGGFQTTKKKTLH